MTEKEGDERNDRGTTARLHEDRAVQRPQTGAVEEPERSTGPYKVAGPVDKVPPDGRTSRVGTRDVPAKPANATTKRPVVPANTKKDISVAEAIRLNRRYAKELGWIADTAFNKIARLMGFMDYTPSEEALVLAVRKWQSPRNLPPDGVISGQTWIDLVRILDIATEGKLPTFRQLNWAHERGGIRVFGTRSPSPPNQQWARAEVITALETVAWNWYNDPHNTGGVAKRESVGRSLLIPGDLSGPFEGPLKPHDSHNIGLDADVYTTLEETNIRATAYSPEKALALADLFFKSGAVLIGFKAYEGGAEKQRDHKLQRVFTERFGFVPVDQPSRQGKSYGKQYPRVVAWKGHENHFHVRW